MSELKVAWHTVTLVTGKVHAQTKAPHTVSYAKGELLDTERFDSDGWRDKIERLKEAGALVEPDQDLPEAEPFVSPLDVPLSHSGEESLVREEVDSKNDDLSDDDDGDDIVSLERPPLNASGDVWRAYARAAGVEMENLEEAKRDEVIAAADAQGK